VPLFTKKHTVSSKRVYEGCVINFRVDELKTDEGNKAVREIVEHNGGVVILCQPDPDQIVLVKQYRYAVDHELIELPAGRIDIGELPLIAAQRELLEETGYRASDWQEVANIYSAPGFCTELLYFFRAAGVKQVGKQLDDDEETEVLLLPLTSAWHLALSGEIQDAKTIAGLALLKGGSA
jgi:ADP-ribose pyrophosphatase